MGLWSLMKSMDSQSLMKSMDSQYQDMLDRTWEFQ
jgi:hypothetical protein